MKHELNINNINYKQFVELVQQMFNMLIARIFWLE